MSIQHINHDGAQLAYRRVDGAADRSGPVLIWCGGLKSDMDGTKAAFLHERCDADGRAFVRFDYFGHGASEGDFIDGTISRWASDTVAIVDAFGDGDVVLIGSSMGGWTSLLAGMERPKAVKGLILVNPAPDFTEKMVWTGWDDHKRQMLVEDGVVYEPSDYGEPYAYGRALIEDGRRRQILDAPIPFDGPVEILQGAADDVVPPAYSRLIVKAVTSERVGYTLIKGGDHSLSRPDDLDRLWRAVDHVLARL
ncbi:alpha/beta hydrolase [uncultured Algimonas sp.]|uniref:alpha/beta hydrolase n=1 Tax=uncultured Algimonas sp. TaxID=1547920 RepID=UPI00261C69D1|nr:alpha/beta hydrolase [uncultured Algimonas sp.]